MIWRPSPIDRPRPPSPAASADPHPSSTAAAAAAGVPPHPRLAARWASRSSLSSLPTHKSNSILSRWNLRIHLKILALFFFVRLYHYYTLLRLLLIRESWWRAGASSNAYWSCSTLSSRSPASPWSDMGFTCSSSGWGFPAAAAGHHRRPRRLLSCLCLAARCSRLLP